jgi:tetratricopeptide (TPR) repeat protein
VPAKPQQGSNAGRGRAWGDLPARDQMAAPIPSRKGLISGHFRGLFPAPSLPISAGAIVARPDYADAQFNLALLLTKLDRYGEALAEWERLLQFEP